MSDVLTIKKGRGGSRIGSGRPIVDHNQVTYHLPDKLVSWVKSEKIRRNEAYPNAKVKASESRIVAAALLLLASKQS